MKAERYNKLTIFGDDYLTPDGTCQRDFIHIVDLAQGFELLNIKLLKHI